jgi:hypothetical protein
MLVYFKNKDAAEVMASAEADGEPEYLQEEDLSRRTAS